MPDDFNTLRPPGLLLATDLGPRCGLAPALRANVTVLAAEGDPPAVLTAYVRNQQVDLVSA